MNDKRQGIAAGIIKFFLSLLSFSYYCGIEVIKFLYRLRILKSYHPACKVVSVGNITLGGTGKTPLVLALARRLKDSGKRTVILSRGYKGDNGTSDEVELLKKHLPDVPVLVGRDRIKTARQAVESLRADIILLDDGFQHWRLKRDLDIVTLDINNPFGNGRIIPRGILRESLSSLKRAGILVLTKVGSDGDSIAKAQGLKTRLGVISAGAAVFTSSYMPSKLFDIANGEELKLSEIENKKIALVCAIGEPESFEETAISLGADIVLRFFFMDHHKYSEKDIETVINACRDKNVDIVLTTEKDVPRLVRSSQLTGDSSKIKFLALGIEMKIDNEERCLGRLFSIFNS